MFKKKKMAAEIVRLRYRVQELEERLCPCEQHQWLITNEECDVGTAPGDVTTYYTYKCRRCGKKEELGNFFMYGTGVTGMADMMNFPKRWEDFLHDYEFEDARRIYTNGSRLIPSFRVKQMMEHYAPVRYGRWDKVYKSKVTVTDGYVSSCCDMWNERRTRYCPNCGARMDEEGNNER